VKLAKVGPLFNDNEPSWFFNYCKETKRRIANRLPELESRHKNYKTTTKLKKIHPDTTIFDGDTAR
jgi:hypothetical protein